MTTTYTIRLWRGEAWIPAETFWGVEKRENAIAAYHAMTQREGLLYVRLDVTVSLVMLGPEK